MKLFLITVLFSSMAFAAAPVLTAPQLQLKIKLAQDSKQLAADTFAGQCAAGSNPQMDSIDKQIAALQAQLAALSQ